MRAGGDVELGHTRDLHVLVQHLAREDGVRATLAADIAADRLAGRGPSEHEGALAALALGRKREIGCELELLPRDVRGWVGVVLVPDVEAVLHLHGERGLIALVLEVVVEPLQGLLGPVPAHVAVLVDAVRVGVRPLAQPRARRDPGLLGFPDPGDDLARVDVPVLHAVHDEHGPVVALQHAVAELAHTPVVAASIPRGEGLEALDLGFSGLLAELAVHRLRGLGPDAEERPVDDRVHDGAPGLAGTVLEHEIRDAGHPADGHDGLQMRVAVGGGHEGRGPVVAAAHHAHVAVAPRLLGQPGDGVVHVALLVEAHELHAAAGLTGAANGHVDHGVTPGHEPLDDRGPIRDLLLAGAPVRAGIHDHGQLARLRLLLVRPVAALDVGPEDA